MHRLLQVDEAEHAHLLINYPPKHSVSSLANSLKGASSRLLRSERPDLEKRYWNHVLWSPSCFAVSCGGAPLGIIKQYALQQKSLALTALYPRPKVRGFTAQVVRVMLSLPEP